MPEFIIRIVCVVQEYVSQEISLRIHPRTQKAKTSAKCLKGTLVACFYTVFPTEDEPIVLNYPSHEETIHQKNHTTRHNK